MKLWGNSVVPGYDEATDVACQSCRHTPTAHANPNWIQRLTRQQVWVERCTAQNYEDTPSGLPEFCGCKHSFHVLNYA